MSVRQNAGMSAKAWWTLAILAAPFLYILSVPPVYLCVKSISRSDSLELSYAVKGMVDDTMNAYAKPYRMLGQYPPLEWGFRGYNQWWSKRLGMPQWYWNDGMP